MIDPLSLAVGGVLLGAGFLAGRAGRRANAPKPAQPICSCGHGLAYHDRQTGNCHAEESRDEHNHNGSVIGQVWVPCTCRRYVGPEPLADVWVPPIASTPQGDADA